MFGNQKWGSSLPRTFSNWRFVCFYEVSRLILHFPNLLNFLFFKIDSGVVAKVAFLCTVCYNAAVSYAAQINLKLE